MLAASEGPQIVFRLIGGFRVSKADGTPLTVKSRRLRGLLAYLVFAPDHAASRERLRGLLWGDRGEAQARASLRQCLRELKSMLPEAGTDLVDLGRETIVLTPGAFDTDIAALKRALEGDDVEAVAGAIAAMAGETLLGEMDFNGPYNEWLEQTRTRIDRELGSGFIAHVERLEARADWPSVRRVAEAYLSRDPLDEAVVAAAMRADFALGNATAAHRRFQALESGLAKEYGVKAGAAARGALTALQPEATRTDVSAEKTPSDGGRPASGAPLLVVVANFVSSSQSEKEMSLAGALRDEIVSGLSRFRDIQLVTDSRPLEGLGVEASTDRIGAYALGASLRLGDQDGRLTVQLVSLGDLQVVWSTRFEMPQVHLVQTVDDTIARVVGAVLPTINADLVRRPRSRPSDEAYRRYLAARDGVVRLRDHGTALDLAENLEAMIAAEPSFPLPYLPLAYLYNTDFGFTKAGASGPREQARALELSKAALALDRSHIHGYTTAGWCYLRREQWDTALMHFEQALKLNLYHARRVMEIAFGLMFLGEEERARLLLDRCLLLSPEPEDEVLGDAAFFAMIKGDHDRADSYFDLVAAPNLWTRIHAAINAEMAGTLSTEKTRLAREAIAEIWPDQATMTDDAVIRWIAVHEPFRSPKTRDRYFQAARRMLAHG